MSIYDSKAILIYCCVLAAVVGAVFGSFLNCAAWRSVHGESVWKGRSHCPSCGHTLGAAELVPVFSWLFLRGRCRWCGVRIPARYVLAELFFACVTVLCLLRFDLTVLCLRNWLFLCCLFCLSLADLESFIIPDGCIITAAAVWLAALPFLGMSWREIGLSALSAVVYGGGLLGVSLVMDRVLKRESLGGGDVKLFAVMGLYLGLAASLAALLLSCVLGLLFALVYHRTGGRKGGGSFPFGPSIAAAACIVLLYGEAPVRWYLGLIGTA